MFLSALASDAAHAQQLYACVNNSSGTIKMVAAGTACDNGATLFVWNAAGPIGPQGPQGPAGPAGATGSAGPAGPAGATGSTGPAGPAGATGATGATGPAGAQGAMGQQGPAGPQGPAGVLAFSEWTCDGSVAPTQSLNWGPTGISGGGGVGEISSSGLQLGLGIYKFEFHTNAYFTTAQGFLAPGQGDIEVFLLPDPTFTPLTDFILTGAETTPTIFPRFATTAGSSFVTVPGDNYVLSFHAGNGGDDSISYVNLRACYLTLSRVQ
jgi:hypothetical protein